MFGKYVLVGALHFATVAAGLKLFCLILPSCVSCHYACIANFLLSLFVARFTFRFTRERYLNERVQPDNKAVLITGCDTGFGNALARRLDSSGFHVFASCLFPEGPDASQLKSSCSKRLQVVGLDVTSDESVQKTLEFVKENLGTSELWAVVNNAGIMKGLSTELSTMDDFKDTLEVNSFGMVRVTKAFLPMLRQSKGRVVNLTSLNGKLPAPHYTPYVMSKFAAEGFTEALRQELSVWGVRVINVHPEGFATQLTNTVRVAKAVDDCFAKVPASVKSDYGDEYQERFKVHAEHVTSLTSSKIDKVIDALEDGVSAEYPSPSYDPARNPLAKAFIYLLESAPITVRDSIVKSIMYLTNFPKPKEARNYSYK